MHRPYSSPRGKTPGAARALLLGMLGLAVAVMGASIWYLVRASSPGYGGAADDIDAVEGGGVAGTVNLPDPDRRARKPRTGQPTPDDEEDDDEGDIDPVWIGDGTRPPDGESLHVTHDSIRKVFAAKHWEEFRRQIDALQREGKALPEDLRDELLAMLRKEDRTDAVLALGQVKDDATGLLLAQLAADGTADAQTRVAALQALTASGQAAGITHVRGLLEKPADDGAVTRHALFALASMGGDGIGVLIDAFRAHKDDTLTDAVLTALAKAPGSDAYLAREFRAARDKASLEDLELLLRASMQKGRDSGGEMRTEVKQIVESQATLEGLDAESRQRVYANALNVAASMGGEPYRAVVVAAKSKGGAEAEMALYALRNGRGDPEADTLLEEMPPDWVAAQTPHVRAYVASALGATQSQRAAPRAIQMLDDEDPNVRQAAASALGQIHDPKTAMAMLDRLEKSLADFTLSHTLIQAIGRSLAKATLPRLREILAKDFPLRDSLAPYLRQAIYRIESGNADATMMVADPRAEKSADAGK
jgi:HEAT repeat protein